MKDKKKPTNTCMTSEETKFPKEECNLHRQEGNYDPDDEFDCYSQDDEFDPDEEQRCRELLDIMML